MYGGVWFDLKGFSEVDVVPCLHIWYLFGSSISFQEFVDGWTAGLARNRVESVRWNCREVSKDSRWKEVLLQLRHWGFDGEGMMRLGLSAVVESAWYEVLSVDEYDVQVRLRNRVV